MPRARSRQWSCDATSTADREQRVAAALEVALERRLDLDVFGVGSEVVSQPPLDSDVGEVRKRPLDPAGAEDCGIAHEHRPHAQRAAWPTSASVPIPKITSGIRNLLTRPRDCAAPAVLPGPRSRREPAGELQRALLRLASCAVAGGSQRSSHRAQIRADGQGSGWAAQLKLVLGQPGPEFSAAGREPRCETGSPSARGGSSRRGSLPPSRRRIPMSPCGPSARLWPRPTRS